MSTPSSAIGANESVLFLVSAGLTMEVIAAACSSPQTAEINADKRADTLMKWVHIGLAVTLLYAGASIFVECKMNRPWWPALAGSGSAAVIMYALYLLALKWGTESNEPGVES